MTIEKHTCPLYKDGQIDRCELTGEGCPVFGYKERCIAYHEVDQQIRLLREIYLEKKRDSEGLTLRLH